jgi:hypothetical protein
VSIELPRGFVSWSLGKGKTIQIEINGNKLILRNLSAAEARPLVEDFVRGSGVEKQNAIPQQAQAETSNKGMERDEE